jgi:hypothetical protein
MLAGFIPLAVLVLVFFCFIAPGWSDSPPRSIGCKFMTGYLPYTALAIAILYVGLKFMYQPPFDEFVVIAMGALILQLIVLRIPWRDRVHFHGACVLITAASLLLSPLVPFIAFLFLF